MMDWSRFNDNHGQPHPNAVPAPARTGTKKNPGVAEADRYRKWLKDRGLFEGETCRWSLEKTTPVGISCLRHKFSTGCGSISFEDMPEDGPLIATQLRFCRRCGRPIETDQRGLK